MGGLTLPMLVSLALKYGPEATAAIRLAKNYGPLVVDIVKLLAPYIRQQVPNGLPHLEQVNVVLKRNKLPEMDRTEKNRLEEMWMNRASGGIDNN